MSSDWNRRARRILAGILVIAVLVTAISVGKKASNGRSAFIRWRGQVQALVAGENVYTASGGVQPIDEDDEDLGPYPNPPIMGLSLYPFAVLPPVAGALLWFFVKVIMIGLAIHWSGKLVAGAGQTFPLIALIVTLLLSARVIHSDLKHGNINILIAFLVVVGLWGYANGRDAAAGLLLALATAFKVTPALFLLYFVYKRQWRMVGWMLLGLALFLLVIPGVFLGFKHNLMLLHAWADAMIFPYTLRGEVLAIQINQSVPGLLHRLLTDTIGIQFNTTESTKVNLVSLSPQTVGYLIKAITLAILLILAVVCRTSTTNRRDWRLSYEYSLILIAMLMISERSWKHHYVTMILPFAALSAHIVLHARSVREKWLCWGTLAAAMGLMMCTSKELAGWAGPNNTGHKYAQAYGLFLAAGVAVFLTICGLLIRHTDARCAKSSREALAVTIG